MTIIQIVPSSYSSLTKRKSKANYRRTKTPLEKNPMSLRRHFRHFPEKLKNAILKSTNKGVLKRISRFAFATPYGVKANCYAHFLTLPKSEWQNRKAKTQPGDKCQALWAKGPLQFDVRGQASSQLIRRVLCDNPDVVHFIDPTQDGYPQYITQIKLPEGYVLGCCIVGGQDFHFCRREGILEMLNNPFFKDIWLKKDEHNVKQQLQHLRDAGELYCWSHIGGWGGRLKLVDASGNVITNPADKSASGNAIKHMKENRCNHNYDGLHYDTFVGFFIIKARAATVKNENKLPRNMEAVEARLRSLGITAQTSS